MATFLAFSRSASNFLARAGVFYWLLALMPSLIYPLICWSYWKVISFKKVVVDQVVGDDAKKRIYTKSFAPTAQTNKNPFSTLFDITFNLNAYIIAIAFNMVISLFGMVVCIERAGFPLGLPAKFEAALGALPLAVLSGIGGAVAFGLFDLLRKYRSSDLSAIALHFNWLRVVVVAILSGIAGQVLKEGFSSVVAFGMGVFPLMESFDWARKLAEKQMGITVNAVPFDPPMLHKLQGMTPSVIERLDEENIDSTQKLALADPIRLLLRTNLEWKDILDYIDQAFLYNYIGDKIADLRPIGIRGALEMIDLWESLGQEEGTLKAITGAEQKRTMLHVVSEKINQDLVSTRNLLMAFSGDIHLLFIRTMWSQTVDEGR